MKKISAVLMTLSVSLLGLTTAFAGGPMRHGPKKWSPAHKPETKQVFYDEKGKEVNVKNLSKVKGKTLYDDAGNAYEIKNGKIILMEKDRALNKRLGSGPVA
ncbi:MAG: hypothetical protein DRH04_01475 [Deltaproteobacteria bacterium]|nr:MAG: hypothetical protein DRH04_01475 [Deltaproteobacteria bacterium]